MFNDIKKDILNSMKRTNESSNMIRINRKINLFFVAEWLISNAITTNLRGFFEWEIRQMLEET